MPYLLRFKARLSFGVTERPPDMVASMGNSDLDDPEADCQGSDTWWQVIGMIWWEPRPDYVG